MTSDKKANANRQNALKSTGPKTPEGKASVRHNAMTHGLLSQDNLLPGEDESALKELGERLRAELKPVGELESLLVEQIVTAYWRLRRLGRVEAGIFAWQLYGELAKRAQEDACTYERSNLKDILEKRYESSTRMTDGQKHQEVLSKAQEMKAK